MSQTTLSQVQLDLQNQLEQTNNTDLTTQPLFNDSPLLFLEVMDQAPSLVNTEQSFNEQTEYPVSPEKLLTPPGTNNYDQSPRTSQPNKYEQSHTVSQSNNYEQSHGTPPSSKKRYEIMRDPAFFPTNITF